MLAIGIVVDDAIVVVEAVQHYIDHEKLSPKEATQKAMKDISGPVIAIALILAAVFVPVGFIPGIVGRLYQQFAITIAVSVLISAFVALSLTPALCSIMLKPSKDEGAKKNWLEKFFAWFKRGLARLTLGYTRGVGNGSVKLRWYSVMLVVLFVGLFSCSRTNHQGLFRQKMRDVCLLLMKCRKRLPHPKRCDVKDIIATNQQNTGEQEWWVD